MRVPAYHAYRGLLRDLLERERRRLRLEEFTPKVLTSFVRNRLIDEVYLPLIGANLEAISKYISGKRMVPMPSSLHQRRWRRRRAPGRAAFAGGQKP